MAEDWAADVKKYAPKADDNVIAGIVRYCGIALTKRDSSLVAFSDSKETDRVRNNFLKKKLARTEADSVLDAAIAAVGEVMKADRTKNRVTVYYLLADKFDSLGLFLKSSNAKPKAPAKATGAAAEKKPAAKAAPKTKAASAPKAKATGTKTAAAAGGAALGLAALSSGDKAEAKAAVPAANDSGVGTKATATLGAAGAAVTGAAATLASGAASAADKAGDVVGDAAGAVAGAAGAAVTGAAALAGKAGDAVGGAASGAIGAASAGADKLAGAASSLVGNDDESSSSWLWWLLLGLLALFLIWWLFLRGPADTNAAVAPAATEAAAGASVAADDLSVAPAEGTVTIPTGAGVTSELRDGKPVVKVYFDTAKTDVATAFTGAAGGLKAWLDGHPGTSLAVSGFADPTGNAAANAELSKQRAQAVQAALVAAGIPEASAALVKPDDSTDATVDKAAARRVEVTVR